MNLSRKPNKPRPLQLAARFLVKNSRRLFSKVELREMPILQHTCFEQDRAKMSETVLQKPSSPACVTVR